VGEFISLYTTRFKRWSSPKFLMGMICPQTNLRIDIHRFVKELLRDQRRTVGRLDSCFTGIDRDAAGENYDFAPSYATIQGPYTATLNDYCRRTSRWVTVRRVT
jgi:carboxypeptidase C (cathepsin A)